MDGDGEVSVILPDGEVKRLGHINGTGDYEAPPELWMEWARLRNEYWLDRQSARAERAERHATYRSQQGF